MPDIRSFYMSVLSLSFSPCENYLAAGTSYGNVNIFKLSGEEDGEFHETEKVAPVKHFQASHSPIQGMVSTKELLIVGGRNCLLGYEWEQLKLAKGLGKDVQPGWKTDLNLPRDLGLKETTDYIILDDDGALYVACGDCSIQKIDLEYGKSVSNFTGHEDFIHGLSSFGNQLSSASEDGSVILWDVRKGKAVHKILPSSHAALERPKLGKWIGAVAMNDDWLVCGGGPRLALYHLRSLTMSRVLIDEDLYGINAITFNEDNIIVGMDGPHVYHVLFSGSLIGDTKTTPLRAYSLALQRNEKRQLAVGGAGAGIDICLQSKFRDRVAYCIS